MYYSSSHLCNLNWKIELGQFNSLNVKNALFYRVLSPLQQLQSATYDISLSLIVTYHEQLSARQITQS